MTNLIELTKCRAGFYYYFTATAQYLVKKEGNQWAFYKTVKGEIDGKALIVARTLALLKEAIINFVDSEIDSNDQIPKIVDVQQLTSNSVEEQITQNFNDNEPDDDLHLEWSDFHQAYLSVATGKVVISLEHNEPDGDDRPYPSEIDSPDPDFDHDTPEVDYPDYSLMVAEVKKDIAEGEFLHKIPHYLKLLQVTREQFDSFVIADVDFDKIGDEDWMAENDESLYDITYEIDEEAVLNRLSQLYEKTDYQALLDKFKEENPHFTILESNFFTVPYWHLTEQKLLIFGYGGDGDKWNVFSVISFTTNRTNRIFDGNYQQSRLIYQEYCGNTANFTVIPPRAKDPILERYKQELTPDYRVFTRKQLALF